MTLFWMHLRKDIKKMTKIIFATGNAGKCARSETLWQIWMWNFYP